MLVWLTFTVPSFVFAHPGGRDADGGHYNKKTGEYHCHSALCSSKVKANSSVVIKQGADEAKVQTAEADISFSIGLALKRYKLDNGAFPTSDEGLQALLIPPAGAKQWLGPYVNGWPYDPWGREYRYVSPGKHGDYDLISLGQDGMEGTHDDITSWK